MTVQSAKLRQISLFASLSEHQLDHIAGMTTERHYGRGDIILLEGDKGGDLCFVSEGLVKVFKTSPEGREQVLRLIAAGYTFNDVPALDGGPNPASAAAMESSTVYLIRHTDLRQLILAQPEVAAGVIRTLAQALRHLVGLVEDLSLRHVTARVAKLLLEQESSASIKSTGHQLTQQEMAAIVGTAREVVGRALKELETAGAIEMRQGRAMILNRERLQVLSGIG